jgi:hypothetical protein
VIVDVTGYALASLHSNSDPIGMERTRSGRRDADAAYIAAASPDVVTRLIDRLEAAERDARRYRGLRENALMTYPSCEGSNEPGAYLTVTGYGDAHDPGVIDAAIDTALAAKEQSNG